MPYPIHASAATATDIAYKRERELELELELSLFIARNVTAAEGTGTGTRNREIPAKITAVLQASSSDSVGMEKRYRQNKHGHRSPGGKARTLLSDR